MHLFFGYASQKSTFIKKELFCFCFFSQNQMSKMKNEDNWYKMKWSELKNELDSKNMDWIKDVLLVNFIVETLPIYIYLVAYCWNRSLYVHIFFQKYMESTASTKCIQQYVQYSKRNGSNTMMWWYYYMAFIVQHANH